MKKLLSKMFAVLALSLALCANAFALDPTTLAEVGTNITTDITSNQGMLFTVMGAIMGVAVLLLIFRRAKGTVK